jgi:uncharacterized protein (TIGR03083 family)
VEDLPAFSVLLRLIDERAVVFRGVVAAAAGLAVPVPTCPEWTLFELVQHLGQGQRRWGAIVAAGPGVSPPDGGAAEGAPAELAALLAWSAESTAVLLDALREAGPDRECWTWWGGGSQSPSTAWGVARHQVQEAAVHTYDAQVAVGDPRALPDDVALDGVGEFLATCCSTTSAWPHRAADLDFVATEGRSWRLSLSAAGGRAERLAAEGTAPTASVSGSASEVVLMLYDRIPIDSLRLHGNRGLFDLLRAWDPDD